MAKFGESEYVDWSGEREDFAIKMLGERDLNPAPLLSEINAFTNPV